MASPFEAKSEFDAKFPEGHAGPERTRKIKAAMAWLESELEAGPQEAGLLLTRGELHGHARRTLQEAASRLHVKKTRVYGESHIKVWQWAKKARR